MSNGSVKRTSEVPHGTSKRRAEAGQIPYNDNETVKEILDDTLHAGVLDAVTVTDAGGLNITWSAGEIYTPAGDIVETVAGGGACTDDAVNYLVWVSGTGLTLRTTDADVSVEVAIAHISVGDDDIYQTHEEPLVSAYVPTLQDAQAHIIPIVVTTGCVVSATNPGVDLEASVSTGIYFHHGHDRHDLTGYDTSTASTLIRCHLDGGATWSFVTGQDFPDLTKYNTGAALVAAAANRYYRGLFVVSEDNVFWIYAQAEHLTLNAALSANDPTVPAGISSFPKSIAYIYQGLDAQYAAAGSEQWVDVRPLPNTIAAFTAGGINNVVEDSTPQLGGSLDSNGNPIAMATTDKITFYSALAYIYATAAGALSIFADTLLTLGKAGVTTFGDGTLRVVRPNTDLKTDLGDATHYFNDAYIKVVQSLAGAGTATYLHGGVIDVDTTTLGNDIGGGLTTLITYDMPANTLATDGDSVEVICAGVFANVVTSQTISFVTEGAIIYTQTQAAGTAATNWWIHATIIRTGASASRVIVSFVTDDTTMLTEADYGTDASSLAAAFEFGCRARGVAADDVEQHFMKTTYHPAP